MIYRLVRPALFALDPETAHRIALGLASALERILLASGAQPRPVRAPELEQEVWGLRFPNPVGLAAGFDKNARAPHAWAALGFGFAELGTVTALAQPGNPRPRIFRLPLDRALINRLGFNNEGADAIRARLQQQWRPVSVPIGINLGKSRATPVESAAEDYEHTFEALFPYADYIAVNVSSPNTPGLRDLQNEADLEALLRRLATRNRELAERQGVAAKPVLVKIAPDLSDEALVGVVRAARMAGASGLIATNTTITRDRVSGGVASEEGGLSGAPLRRRATEIVRAAFRAAAGTLPIIGVGGIFNGDDAYEKIAAGASLVQIYTGLIYEGPFLARRIVADLRRRLRSEGVTHLRELIGRDAA